ncbi:MAG: T9SS type A sorting domain-containing protein [Opitutaceae bacterium]|nr:T9SS type A sorting domain-containing protein [Opitutaceae bacterium]
MLKNICIVFSLIFSGGLTAQSFQELDTLDNLIGNDYTFIGTGGYLSLTKVHVTNISSTNKTFKASVYEVSNPTGVDFQICFDGGCFIIPAGTPSSAPVIPNAAQLIAPSGIFNELKIGPFSGLWVAGDSAVWNIKLFNELDVNDTVTANVTWKHDGSVSIEIVNKLTNGIDVFPNPVKSELTINAKDKKLSEVVLMDLTGKVFLREPFMNKMNVGLFPTGIYILQLIDENRNSSYKKIIIE